MNCFPRAPPASWCRAYVRHTKSSCVFFGLGNPKEGYRAGKKGSLPVFLCFLNKARIVESIQHLGLTLPPKGRGELEVISQVPLPQGEGFRVRENAAT